MIRRADMPKALRDAKEVLLTAHALCEDVARGIECDQRKRVAGDAGALLDALGAVEATIAALRPTLRRMAPRSR